jgi:hypothetical protein
MVRGACVTQKWNLPLTYRLKIPAVLDGRCTQTIRAGRKFQVGDLISFHGWEGKPYRSKWSFRTPYFKVILAEDIKIMPNGIFHELADAFLPWHDPRMDILAIADGIDPPIGQELGGVLTRMHKVPYNGLPAQIITWTRLDPR